MLSVANTLANIIENNNVPIEHSDIKKLAGAARKHLRAGAAFLSDMESAEESQQLRDVRSLAASYRAEVSKSGLSASALGSVAETLHDRIKARRNKAKQDMFLASRAKDADSFASVRAKADEVKTLDSLLADIANYIGVWSRISGALAEVA